MSDPNVIARRLLALHDALGKLARPECADAERHATDAVLRAAVERWLQVAVEACIDLAHHVVASEGWTPSATARAAFATLAGHGRIPTELAARLGRAAGLRNVLVHDYVDVDLALLARVVGHDLEDLRAFARAASGWTKR